MSVRSERYHSAFRKAKQKKRRKEEKEKHYTMPSNLPLFAYIFVLMFWMLGICNELLTITSPCSSNFPNWQKLSKINKHRKRSQIAKQKQNPLTIRSIHTPCMNTVLQTRAIKSVQILTQGALISVLFFRLLFITNTFAA